MPGDFSLPLITGPFFGRKRELEEIETFFRESRRHRENILKIVGPGGSGKTSLARQAVHSQPQLRPVWVDFQLQNQSPRQFSSQYLDHVLSRDGPRSDVLVVLDGVEGASEATLMEWLSAIFNYKRVAGLILTSRSRIPLRGHEIFLGGLSSDDVREFLHSNLRKPLSAQEIEAFVSKSGGLPLAVSLISGLLKEHSTKEILSHLDGQVYALKQSDESRIVQVVRPQIITFSDELTQQLRKTPEKIHDVTSRQFEHLIADLFDDMGWEVELTKATRDGGRDILAHLNTGTMRMLCLIEAKKYRKDRPVGVQLVRNLYGTFCDEQANSAMLVTTSYFSEEAKKFQEKHEYQLTLKDYADVVGWLTNYKGSKSRPK